MSPELISRMRHLKGWRLNLYIVLSSLALSEIFVALSSLLLFGELRPLALEVTLGVTLAASPILAYIFTNLLDEISKAERHSLEDAAQRARENLKMAIEVAQMDIWELDLITNAVTYNIARVKIPGFSAEVPPRSLKDWQASIHPDDLPQFRQRVQQAMLPGAANFDFEYRVALERGHWAWVHTRGGIIERDASGKPLKAAGTTINISERKLAEFHLNQAVESAQMILWELQLSTGALRFDDDKLDMLGVEFEGDIHTISGWMTHIHPDDQVAFQEKFALTVRTPDAKFDHEYRLQSKSGDWVWVQTKGLISQRNPAGEPIAASGGTFNIQSRKLAEERLLKNETLLLTTLESTDEGILMIGHDGHVLSANKRFLQLWHIPTSVFDTRDDDQLLSYVLEQLNDPEDFLGLVRKLYDSDEQARDILSFKDGRVFSRFTQALTIDGQRGRIWCFKDITEQHRTETELRTSEQKMLTILDNVDAYIYLKDTEGKYLFANRNVRELWGVEMAGIVGFGDDKFFDAITTANIRKNDRGVLDRGETHTVEETNTVIATGQTFTYLSTKLPLRNEDGTIYALCGVSTDITDRIRAEQALKISEARARTLSTLLRLITDNVTDMIWAKDRDKRYLFANKAICEQLLNAKDTEEPIGKDDLFFAMREREAHPNDPDWHTFGELCQDSDAITLQRGAPSQFDEFGNVKGKFLFLDVHKAPFVNDAGEVIGVVGSARDVTQQKIIEEKLRLASMVLENSSEAMFITDERDLILEVNPAFTHLTGYRAEEVIGKSPKMLRSGKHDSAFYRAMFDSLSKTGRWQGEIWNRRKNGEIFAEWQTINTIYNEDGSVHRYVALFSDITEKKKSEELIWAQANFDQLTGLPNRRMFRDRLTQDIKKAHRAGLGLALMFLDLDRFKEVNDSWGHDTGDALLIEAAQRIAACVRESDTVARLGGDEFTIILAELDDRASVERIAAEILRSLSLPFELGENVAYVSASIGITIYPDDAMNLENMLKNADQAMYVAKNAGRNRFSYFTNAMQERALYRLHIMNDLRNALAEQQLQLHYQPIVDIHTGRIHKAEALLRWFHPKRGLISPAEFIPLAEESGLIHEIGDWVFEQTVAQTLKWTTLYGSDFQISINKSPIQIQTKSERCRWREHLSKTGLSGKHLVIEITEGVLLDHTPAVTSELLAFRDAGIQVAIDDFGTGYSALSYLKKLDIDYVKIDQAFILTLETDDNDKALAEAIVVMAHKLGLKVIAEGVETQTQLDLLKKMGCDYAQGFLYSRALAPEDFERLMENRQG